MFSTCNTIAAFLFLLSSVVVVDSRWGAPTGARSPGCPSYTKLLPRYDLYRKHCEAESGPSGSDPKWPCFTMWYGDLGSANATVDNSKTAPDDFFLIKNGYKIDFTTRDPKQPFTLTWFFGDISMSYSDFDQDKGCYKITLKHDDNNKRRIWVSDDVGKDKDIDTDNYHETHKTLCTKWLRVHVKEDTGSGL